MEGINWLAVLVAAASALVVGFIWYNPKVFGARWMREVGISMDGSDSGGAMAQMFITTFVLSAIGAFYMAYQGIAVHGGPEFATFKHGAYHGGLLGLLVGLTIIGTSALYERRSWTYIAISTGFWAVVFAVMGGILSAWQ